MLILGRKCRVACGCNRPSTLSPKCGAHTLYCLFAVPLEKGTWNAACRSVWLRIDGRSQFLPPTGVITSWYSPAYFSGRVLVNISTGTVDHFRLALPTDKMLNVHLTVDGSRIGFVAQLQ